ncbi:MAG: hypothetical protein KIT58_00320 [Planctomycetota bacterium]|nr:hypothetical protein [Planctomycetota bacterium]
MHRGTSTSSDAARLGLAVTLRPGDDAAGVARDLVRLGLPRLRAVLPASAWADDAAGAAALLEALAREVELLPCVLMDLPGDDLAGLVEAALAPCGPEVAWVERLRVTTTPWSRPPGACARRAPRRALRRRDRPRRPRRGAARHADAVGVDLRGTPPADRGRRAASQSRPAGLPRLGRGRRPRLPDELAQAALLAALALPTEQLYWDGLATAHIPNRAQART